MILVPVIAKNHGRDYYHIVTHLYLDFEFSKVIIAKNVRQGLVNLYFLKFRIR